MSAVLEGKQKKSCPNQLYTHVFEYGILLSKYGRKLKHLAALDPLDTTSCHLQLNMIREPFFDFGDIRNLFLSEKCTPVTLLCNDC